MNFSYDQFMMFFYIGIVVSIVFLIVAVVLFFVLKIPRTWSELSGSTERKAINRIREKNAQQRATTTEKMGADVYSHMSSNVQNNYNNSQSTYSNIHNSQTDNLVGNSKPSPVNNNETDILVDNDKTEILVTNNNQNPVNNNETEILVDNNKTEILVTNNNQSSVNNGETEKLVDNGETEILVDNNIPNTPTYRGTVVEENSYYSGQTQVLDDGETEVLYDTNELVEFQILDEIVLCSSNEIVV